MSASRAPSSEFAVTAGIAAVFCAGFGIAALASSYPLRFVWGCVSIGFGSACLLLCVTAHRTQRRELAAVAAAIRAEVAA